MMGKILEAAQVAAYVYVKRHPLLEIASLPSSL